jgi:hypothetical protein
MNLIRKRIKYLLKEIKTDRNNHIHKSKNDYCIINLMFETDVFNLKCSSIGNFMKKLKNGKISLDDTEYIDRPTENNREYFNNLIDGGGFYRYNYSYNFIEINIYLDVKKDLDYSIESEIIKSRISKIVSPIEFQIGFNDKLLLDKTFRDLSIVDTGWNVFGSDFRNKPIE